MIHGRRDRPDARHLRGLGQGRGDPASRRASTTPRLVVFDQDALGGARCATSSARSPRAAPEVRVVDRTDVILEIFAQRARSHEGKLQVELARLRAPVDAPRARAGPTSSASAARLGKTGGPGEKQIELDRRMIGEQVKKLKERIAKVGKRARRRSAPGARAPASCACRSWATPTRASPRSSTASRRPRPTSPTSSSRRSIRRRAGSMLAKARRSRSPTRWASSATFRTRWSTPSGRRSRRRSQADLLLHVVDAANPERDAQVDAVNTVLEEIGADEVPADPGAATRSTACPAWSPKSCAMLLVRY